MAQALPNEHVVWFKGKPYLRADHPFEEETGEEQLRVGSGLFGIILNRKALQVDEALSQAQGGSPYTEATPGPEGSPVVFRSPQRKV